MKKNASRPLIALNAALAAGLAALVWASADSGAQPSAPTRVRGQYTLISGRAATGNANAIYVLDAANSELLAMRWDSGKNAFTNMSLRDIDADRRAEPGR